MPRTNESGKYRCIVADPPWEMKRGSQYRWREGRASGERQELDYATMSLAELAELPVGDLATWDSHLFVWTTQRHLEVTPSLVREWGFVPSCVLAWCKQPHGWGPGGVFQSTLEFIIYARRGQPAPSTQTICCQWFQWPRSSHSTKPGAFQDLLEQNFPGPFLEMFARRQRLGWDTWGDEALEHVEMVS